MIWEKRIELPPEAERTIACLNAHGFEAYAVGGAVRDALLGRGSSDADVATNALPEQVKGCFLRTADTGIAHGTVTVLDFDAPVEVTTYRVEAGYADHRRPDAVRFSPSLAEDLKRRDFTVNALAYHPREGVIDLYGGRDDLRRRTIRAVGDARERFCEDALRMLRAVRFAGQLGFTVSPDTLRAIDQNAPLIAHVSAERVFAELEKLICSEHPEHLRDSMPLLREVLPELALCFATPQNSRHHIYNVGEHTVRAVSNAPPEPVLRWVMLLHDLGKPRARTTDADGRDHFTGHHAVSVELAGEVLGRLRASNALKNEVKALICLHDVHLMPDRVLLKRVMRELDGKTTFDRLAAVQRADAMAQAPGLAAGKLETLAAAQRLEREIVAQGEPYLLRHLAVNGNDLLAAGVAPEQVGEVLSRLLDYVIQHPGRNTPELINTTEGMI